MFENVNTYRLGPLTGTLEMYACRLGPLTDTLEM